MLDKIKAWQVVLAIFIMLGTIGGTGYKFYECKASKQSVENLAGDYHNYQDVQRKRAVEQRIWDIKREKPNSWQNDLEYQRLQSELDLLIIKINAYYNRKGG